jgi:small subunit ribosomal protein S1
MSDTQRRKDDGRVRPKGGMDEALQREVEEALGSMSLEEMIEAEDRARKAATAAPTVAGRPGEAGAKAPPTVKRGRVVAIHGDDIFVDMGGKSQGLLPTSQYDGQKLPTIGDVLELTIEGYDNRNGVLLLSRQGAVMAAAWHTLEEGQSVEGRVTGHNKGGLELDVSGIKAFMPVSMIEMFHVDDLAPYVNQRLRCQVLEIDRGERRLIVSRRAYLEAEAAAKREQMFETLQEGHIVEGKVKTIMPYGAFVDIGGADGLLHVKDMSYSRVEDPRSIVKEGQSITVKILKIDPDTRKIALGLKQVLPDPWDTVVGKYPVNEVVKGRITRLADFGAFIELEPGVEGLIPISEMSFEKRIRHPSEVVGVGQTLDVRVMTVDPEKRRISLSLKRVGDDPWVGASARWPEGTIVSGTVKRATDFGAFVELAPGVEGLVHISELSENRVRLVTEAVQVGQTVDVKVLNIDETARRASLSIKQVTMSPDYTGPARPEREQAPPPKAPKRKRPLKGGLDY